jgi:N utilization substance protein B
MQRRRAREIALQILYQWDPSSEQMGGGPPLAMPDLVKQLQSTFNHFQVPDESREFAGQLVTGALIHRARLDAAIEAHASNWKLGRMTVVDRNLLRLSTYELVFTPETPRSVVIDEAVELGKKFGTAETPAFVNGILDAIGQALENGKLSPGLT